MTPEAPRAENKPEVRIPSEVSFVDQVRQRIFGDKAIVKKMIADKSVINIRRTDSGEWITGRAIAYNSKDDSVEVEWKEGKTDYARKKPVRLDEFMRWQKGEVGESPDTQGF